MKLSWTLLGRNEKSCKNLGRKEVREEKTEQDQKSVLGREGRQRGLSLMVFSIDRCLLHPSKPSEKPLNFIVSSDTIQNKNCQYKAHNDIEMYSNTSMNLGPIFSRSCQTAKEIVSRCFYFTFLPSTSLTQQSKTPNLSCFTIWNSIVQNFILHVKLSKHCRMCIRTTWNTNGCDACSGVQSPCFLILYIKILCTLNKA